MKKFIITGCKRSGTTYLASILNSQDNMFCVEDYPWEYMKNNFKNVEEFLNFSNKIDAKFFYLGLPKLNLKEVLTKNDDPINIYIEHLKKIFKCNNAGFKRTMMQTKEMNKLVAYGYKIIIMKRNVESILKSYISRTNPNLKIAAYDVQEFLKDINFYSPSLPKSSYLVVNFDELMNNEKQVLAQISKFLSYPIVSVSKRYHSFNRGRAYFENNSSFSNKKNINKYTVLSSLSQKYSEEEICEVAKKVEAGETNVPIIYCIKKFIISMYYRLIKS